MNTQSIGYIDPKDFDTVASKLRTFCRSKGFIEVPVQNRLSISAACEDPSTLTEFSYAGKTWPLPQTGQMWLEYELLRNPDAAGFYAISTSYRQEPDPVPGRHDLIFPMFEFELPGDINALMEFEKELLEYLGYGKKEDFPSGTYGDICKKYDADEVGHHEESRLYEDYGPVFFLKDFPEESSPFWNMARRNGVAQKIDVILSGMETFGSAERSVDPVQMRHNFDTISEGQYAKTLYAKFGKQRVDDELNEFLSGSFIHRCGGGIGMTRLIKSMKKEKLM